MRQLPERSKQRRPQQLLVAPGAFKHSMSAAAAAGAIARGLRASSLGLPLLSFPIADGGNGTLDAFLSHGGTRHERTVRSPLGAPVSAAYGLLPDGKTAVIEMALASGLELIDTLDARSASTYGTGELIRAALEGGSRKIIVGLGGSATTDGGAGCLQALGLRLIDRAGHEIPPGGSGLSQIAEIDMAGLHPGLQNTEIIVAADVDNPAVGINGAAAVFGPQKGANPEYVAVLDAALSHWFAHTREVTGRDVSRIPGSGAAGALAGGLIAYAHASIQSGVDLLLDHIGFDDALTQARLVITGEGKLDSQSLSGKGPIGVARRAQARGIEVVAFAGSVTVDPESLRKFGIQAAWPIVDSIMTLEYALTHGAELLERAALRLGNTLAIQIKGKS